MSRTPPTTTLTFALINVLCMAGGAAIAAWSLYPAYDSSRYVSAVAAGIGFGALVVLVADRLGWSGFAVAGLTAVGFLAIGLTLAVPGFARGSTPLAEAVRELVRGPVTGWKDIVTLPLPLGEYGATIVPALFLVLGGTVLAGWLALRARRWWGFAAAVVVMMVATAIVVGPATRAMPLTWAPYGMYINREFLIGLATFALLLVWLGWRATYARRRAVARTAGGARLASSPRVRALSTVVTGAVMVAVAVGVGAIVAGPVAAETPRDVARSVIDPRVVVDSSVAPLASYRNYFSNVAFSEPLFTVKVTEGEADRIRVATLRYFTGDEFTAAAPSDSAASRYERLPSSIAPADATSRVEAEISVRALSGMWLPLVGSLGAISFSGDRAGVLTDSFYYQPDTASGLITAPAGVALGDSYTVVAYEPDSMPTLAELGAAPGGEVIDSSLIPPSLSDWVLRQGVTHDGAGLAILVDRLRERGYLSHGLTQPATPAQWETALGAYSFASSAAGHSYDRVDRMFLELTAREAEAGASGDGNFVAAVGDDEQFATAVALMAADLGFPSRVVLGARLAQTDAKGWTVPVCAEGTCTGRNMAIWTEVQSAAGTWVPIDVTPQHSTPPSPDVQQQQDPKFVSALDPERASPIVPPSTQRGSAAEADPPAPEQTGVWGWLGPMLTVAGISLLGILILIGPLIAIAVWKALRRRRRRRGEPTDAIHHGWDEYVDTAIDAGHTPLPLSTRLETAHVYGSANGERLARLTDAATFGAGHASDADAQAFWDLVAADRASWLAGRGFWRRMRMRLSVRSMLNAVALQAPAVIPESTTRVEVAHSAAKGGE
ncbi:transglutaminase domain-containing protein [Demequina sp.]|uniref:transglutaminase domain-containing protein n=1 Tax=Demequina sp. TaxID=2050685 RepID=UPI003D0D279C